MPQSIACRHCQTICDDSFCPHCGQATATSRITLREIAADVLFSFVKVNRGFLFTARELAWQPGRAIEAYLAGHRIPYYPPHKYLFLLGAVTTFLAVRYQYFKNPYPLVSNLPADANAFLNAFFQYANDYTTLINVVTTPVFALFSFLLLRNLYNYAEHLVINAYITAQQLLFLIVLVPLFEIQSARSLLLAGYTLLSVAYNAWVYRQLFQVHTGKGWLRLVLLLILAYVSQFLLNLVVFLVIRMWQ
jgi:hypothetical protein